jgi:hypothetical protein
MSHLVAIRRRRPGELASVAGFWYEINLIHFPTLPGPLLPAHDHFLLCHCLRHYFSRFCLATTGCFSVVVHTRASLRFAFPSGS